MPPRSTANPYHARPVGPVARTVWLAVVVVPFLSMVVRTPAWGEEPEFGEPRLLREAAPVAARDPRVALSGLSPFQPAGVTSRLRRTRLQFEALVADKAWDDAIDLVEQVQAEAGGEVAKEAADASLGLLVEEPDAFVRYTTVLRRTQTMLASLPPEGLAVYRDRLGSSSRRQVDQAIARLDEEALDRVVANDTVTPASRDATLALAELALERGDTIAARRWLQRLDPLAWDPIGRPAACTLAALDPSSEPSEVAAAWSQAERPAALPLTTVDDVAESISSMVLARLALTSLREGDLRRAAAEARLLRGLSPEATGRFAGRQQSLPEALEALLAEQQSGVPADATLGAVDLAWAWDAAASYSPVLARNQRRVINRGVNLFGRPALNIRASRPEPTRTPTLDPAVATRHAYYVERGQLKQLDLVTGEVGEFRLPGVETPEPIADQGNQPGKQNVGQIAARRFVIQGGQRQVIQFGQPAPPRAKSITRLSPDLTFQAGRLYARTTKTTVQPRNRRVLPTIEAALIGIDPENPGEIAIRLTTEPNDPNGNAGYQFGGPPTVRGDRLYVVLTRPGVRAGLAVACYSARSGRELWRTDLGAGEPANRFGGSQSLPLQLAGDTLYLATEMGAVAALDTQGGRLRWLSLYPRDPGALAASRTQSPATPATSCVLSGDQLIVAPADSTKLMAWDAGTGRLLWQADRRQDARLAGVASTADGSVVVLAGRQIASYDTLTGARRFAWPQSDRAGLRGIGQAAVVGGEVFWPTRDALYCFDAINGSQTRPPIDLAPVGAAGANLIPTDYGLLVAGPERIRLLASLGTADKTEPATPISRLMEDAPSASQLGRTEPSVR